MKKLVVISDLHCGHRAGLTPPTWQYAEGSSVSRNNFAKIQRLLWNWYTKEAEKVQGPDILVVNGDAVDGKGPKSGNTEQITCDRDEQIEMAKECITQFNAKKILVVEGTPYHTGTEESWEAILAREVNAIHFGAHEWIDINGAIFDFRHKIGSSCIPHGRFTAPARAALWNALWSERGIQPKAQIIIRSHVHYFTASIDSQRMVMTTPSLQTHSKFGSREIDGTNDIGFLGFQIENNNVAYHLYSCDMKNISTAGVLKI